jgi:hypothetical protein
LNTVFNNLFLQVGLSPPPFIQLYADNATPKVIK